MQEFSLRINYLLDGKFIKIDAQMKLDFLQEPMTWFLTNIQI